MKEDNSTLSVPNFSAWSLWMSRSPANCKSTTCSPAPESPCLLRAILASSSKKSVLSYSLLAIFFPPALCFPAGAHPPADAKGPA